MNPSEILEAPTVSVIVPVWNGADTLDACLDALLTQSAVAESYEVLVVDDGSSDGSGQAAARHGVQVIRQKHAGAAAARNRGALHALGEILLFTDADCEPLPDWIEQMRVPFSDPQVVGAKGIYRTKQRSLVARYAQAEYLEKYKRLARSEWIDFVDTYSAAFRQDTFRQYGGFDPEFLLDEDQEFSFRLAEAGLKLKFAPEAAVYHRHPATVWRYAWRKVQLARWKVRVGILHPGKAIQDSYTPWTQKAQIVVLLLAVLGTIAAAIGLVHWSVVAALIALGFGCSLPLVVIAQQQGWSVTFIAPAMILLRALALAGGLLWGMVEQLVRQPSSWISNTYRREG